MSLSRTPTSTRSGFPRWPRREPSTGRTAVYGPVCTVVWEGWSREASPYPYQATPRVSEPLVPADSPYQSEFPRGGAPVVRSLPAAARRLLGGSEPFGGEYRDRFSQSHKRW